MRNNKRKWKNSPNKKPSQYIKRSAEDFEQSFYNGDFVSSRKKINYIKEDRVIPISKGEAIIMSHLQYRGILFDREKSFINLFSPKTKMQLRMDFFLPKLNICIEFDGVQHFEKSKFDTKSNTLEVRQFNDKVKNTYCLNNSIKMKRISYKDMKNIKSIIDSIINLT